MKVVLLDLKLNKTSVNFSLQMFIGIGIEETLVGNFCFLPGFFLTNIHESQDCRRRGRAFL